MQHQMNFKMRSEDEEIKDAGLTIDLDEIGRRGAMSKSEKTIAKWYGIYASRQNANHMARVVTPGAVMTSAQARNIARVSEMYGQGILNLTTRQAVQFHWLKVGNLADMIRALGEEDSTTMHGCGDVTRQIGVCPLAETCPHRRLNVRPWAQRLQKELGDMTDLDNLPRKFKITFSGCQGACAQPFINCLGFIAVQKTGNNGLEKGFQVIAGGGLGWDPYVGQELFSFIPENRALDVARAVALTFRDHGDRYNRATSRLKFVVQRHGIAQVRQWVLDHLKREEKITADLETAPLTETGAPVPDRPLAETPAPAPDGSLTVRIRVPHGELHFRQFQKIAELSEVYADQKVYTNNRQNLELHGVDPSRKSELEEEIHRLGFATDGFWGIKDIVPCVGTTYCPKAVTETRTLTALLEPVISQAKYASIEKKVLINITGCPNSCSPWRIVDLGFRGMRIREESGSVEGYEVLLGGDQKAFGQKLGEFKKDDCPAVTEAVLDHFLKVRQGDETLTACVQRVGAEDFRQAVYS